MPFPLRRDLPLRVSRKVTSDRVLKIPPAAARDANKMTTWLYAIPVCGGTIRKDSKRFENYLTCFPVRSDLKNSQRFLVRNLCDSTCRCEDHLVEIVGLLILEFSLLRIPTDRSPLTGRVHLILGRLLSKID
jgi:hypothetical protein